MKTKKIIIMIAFSFVLLTMVACSKEPVALTEENAEIILGKDYTGKVKIKVPKNVIAIGEYVFSDCKFLESLEIPNSVTQIESRAFEGCTNLKSINIPSNVSEIKIYTFYNCKSLKTITIPSSVTRIEPRAFIRCDSLENIVFEDPNDWYFSIYDGYKRQEDISFSDPIQNVQFLRMWEHNDYFYGFFKH